MLKTTLRGVVFMFADPEMKTAAKVNIVACEAAAPYLAADAHFPNTVKAAQLPDVFAFFDEIAAKASGERATAPEKRPGLN